MADYVLAHKTDVQFMSISELAYESGVAEATISRFCRRLKLKGYNAFKLAVAKATAEEHGGISPTMEGQEGRSPPRIPLRSCAASCTPRRPPPLPRAWSWCGRSRSRLRWICSATPRGCAAWGRAVP